jgi:hypothetical protein
MTRTNDTTRRTALKTIAGAAVGGSLLAGTAGARERGTAPCTNTVDILASHDRDSGGHAFDLSATEIPAGWRRFELENPTEHVHFAYLARLPRAALDAAGDRDLLEFYVERVTNPFQGLMDQMLGEEPRHDHTLPEWFGEVVPSGGFGLTRSGVRSATTVDLDPGEYIVECYVKNGDDEFHSYRGMIAHLTVTEDQTGEAPVSTAELTVSTEGISFRGRLRPGQQTVAVTFEDQQVYEHFLGHDVHLVRLDGATTAEDVNGWTNWMSADGLVADGSEPGTFLGGADTILTPGLLDGTERAMSYVHLNLTAGEYAWVAEVPDPSAKGLLKTFTVTGAVGVGRPRRRGRVTPHPTTGSARPGCPTGSGRRSRTWAGSAERSR